MEIRFDRALIVATLTALLSGCPLDGDNGEAGTTGLAGINCWDTNQNRINDPDEDRNFDGVWDVKDCSTTQQTTQSLDVALNHQHFCEAFATLGRYPEGCPSNSHTVPTGTLQRIGENDFYDDGRNGYESCANTPDNGLLSIVYNSTLDQSYFELEGGYIASQSTMSLQDVILNNSCFNACDADANCVASFATKITPEALTCNVFYHSDTVSAFSSLCGVSGVPNTTPSELCLLALSSNLIWSAKCL
ncbi:hypothetical protein [Vibrio aestuarianus]|uniref:hypothetical protein n=1 Tax=Vibrio aestuarianus TaxID=28171 RepID=UPI00237CD509|nr:hypothetical protein [Vibrio aestuarianus]MDE1240339.1 hypothetical protein [Vibrio aestuarianus]